MVWVLIVWFAFNTLGSAYLWGKGKVQYIGAGTYGTMTFIEALLLIGTVIWIL